MTISKYWNFGRSDYLYVKVIWGKYGHKRKMKGTCKCVSVLPLNLSDEIALTSLTDLGRPRRNGKSPS